MTATAEIRGIAAGQRPALLISECQRGVVEEGLSLFPSLVEQVNQRQIIPAIARLANTFRQLGLPVVHLHVAHKKGFVDVPMTSLIMARSKKLGSMEMGSPGVEAIAGLEPAENDLVHSRGFSLVAFHGTELDAMLRHMGVQTVVLTGVSSNVAIPGMALCASDLGYQAVVPEDCVAGASAETHDYTFKNTLPLFASITQSTDLAKQLAAVWG